MTDVLAAPTMQLRKARRRFNRLVGAAIVLGIALLVGAIVYGTWMSVRVDRVENNGKRLEAIVVELRESSARTECIARELAGPWVGLQVQLKAPVGDVAARDQAQVLIGQAIDRLANLDDYC